LKTLLSEFHIEHDVAPYFNQKLAKEYLKLKLVWPDSFEPITAGAFLAACCGVSE